MRSPLSIAVIGVGGIGSAFGYQLARAGHDVTLVARPGSRRLGEITKDQGIVLVTGERVTTRVSGELDEQMPFDLVIVTTPYHQVEALIPALSRSQAACVHFMFNMFEPERLESDLGGRACSFGMPFLMARIRDGGKLDFTISSSRKTMHGDPRWVGLFNGAGIPSVFEGQMLLWLRCHAPFCIAFESISFTAQQHGGGATWAQCLRVASGVRAALSVVKGLGYRLYPREKAITYASPAFLMATMLWSLSRVRAFRELLATGVNECRALTDTIVAAAAGFAPTPSRDKLIKQIELMKP